MFLHFAIGTLHVSALCHRHVACFYALPQLISRILLYTIVTLLLSTLNTAILHVSALGYRYVAWFCTLPQLFWICFAFDLSSLQYFLILPQLHTYIACFSTLQQQVCIFLHLPTARLHVYAFYHSYFVSCTILLFLCNLKL